ncbi:hypothetical protein AB0H77_23060 [Streptomyces sp. NPDC050844]|uniref:hypothetical protein n=1 Tax=Streptomyces sp. NPDC050844 TaxID=3155790 RepID=UPI0034087E3C
MAAMAALTAIGCAGSGQDDGPSARGDASAESHPARPSGNSSADHTASAKPSPSAADGRDIDACADSNCEIAVSDPVVVRFKSPAGKATVSVTEAGPNKVAYSVTYDSGQSKGGASGPGQGCITVLRSNGSSNSCGGLGDARPSAQPGAVVIQAAAGEDGTAILHIVSD